MPQYFCTLPIKGKTRQLTCADAGIDGSSPASAVDRTGTGAAGSIASGEAPIVTCPGWCVIAAVNESLEVIGVGSMKRLVWRTSTDGRAVDATKAPSCCASLCQVADTRAVWRGLRIEGKANATSRSLT
jgi:hypothetical protein